jgi:hypothetical protein
MSPQVFPTNPVFRSASEEAVFQAVIAGLEEDDAVICNLELSTSDRGEVEVDLVVLIANRGCVIVETKGGHVTLQQGQWIQSDKYGSRVVIPGDQARRNMFAVRDYVRNRWSQGNLKADWLVAIPGNRVPSSTDPQLPSNKIVDRENLRFIVSSMKSNLDALTSPPPRDSKWVEAAIKHLVPSKSHEVDRDEILVGNLDYIKSLTHERAKLLDSLSDNRRYYVRGPAGSGKTWLAFEQARRWSAAGLRVAVIAFNRGITTYLQNKAEEMESNERPSWIGTFHNFASFLGTTAGAPGKYDDNNDRYASQLIAAAERADAEKKFDAFVVDEAQDFMSSWWQTLELCLVDPANGRMALFGDDQQKVFGERNGPSGFFAKFSLEENIRNSQQIAATAKGFTERSMTARGPNSFDVEFIERDENDVIEAADDVVERMTDHENWQPGEIALLTTKDRHPVHARVSPKARDQYWQDFWTSDSVFYGTVGGFKGLERPAVVLAINGFHNSEDFEDFLYVGLTRARDKLIVVAPEAICDLIKERMEKAT